MTYEEMKVAMDAAQEVMRQSQYLSREALRIAAGRLRFMHIDPSVLAELKRELADFNMQTGRWKE